MAKLFPIIVGDLAVLHASYVVDHFPPKQRGLALLVAPSGQYTRPQLIVLQETEAREWLLKFLSESDMQRILNAGRGMEYYYMDRAKLAPLETKE